jgi:hypothetical protein
MAELAKNPIKKYKLGLPCMLGQVVGRIVGESEDMGSWGYINSERMYSIPLFGTPHGSIIKTGVLYLSEIDEEGMKRLEEYEKDAKEKGKELYAGKLESVNY